MNERHSGPLRAPGEAERQPPPPPRPRGLAWGEGFRGARRGDGRRSLPGRCVSLGPRNGAAVSISEVPVILVPTHACEMRPEEGSFALVYTLPEILLPLPTSR